jgi:Icc-related predicted phosphoesterase
LQEEKKKEMKIVLISDTHNKHQEVPKIDCDILCHAGDVTMSGTIHEIQKFGEWLKDYPAEFKVVIAGNHDFGFERNRSAAENALGDGNNGVIYLQDSAVMLNGKKFYGSPWQPWFYDWAFNAWRGPEIKKYWDKIPDDTDVLITHGPAFGMCDKVSGGSPGLLEIGHAGCKDLLNRIREVNPLVHVSGHLHQGRGEATSALHGLTTFYNATIVDEKYRVVYDPYVVEI